MSIALTNRIASLERQIAVLHALVQSLSDDVRDLKTQTTPRRGRPPNDHAETQQRRTPGRD